MNTNTIHGLTSIIIPCWNQLSSPSMHRGTEAAHEAAWELIVVDNGSTDETKSYLAGVRDLSAVPVTIVSNTVESWVPGGHQPGVNTRARGIPGAAE